MRWTIRTKILTGFGLCWAAMVFVGTVASFVTSTMISQAREEKRTHAIHDAIDDLHIEIVNAETSQRGFVITGDEGFLEPYHAALPEIQEGVELLGSLTTDQEQLDTLGGLVSRRLGLLENVIQIRRAQGQEAAQLLVATGEGQKITDDIEALLADIENQVDEIFQQQEATVQNQVQTAIYLIGLGSLLALGTAMMGGLSISNRIHRSTHALLEGVQEIGTGNLDYCVPVTSHDEIADLAHAINRMAVRLKTAQLDLSKSNTLFQGLFESSSDAILTINQQGFIEFANPQTEKLFGYRRHELQGIQIENLLPERFQAAHQQNREEYLGQPQSRAMGLGKTIYGRRQSGEEFPVEITLGALTGTDAPRVLIVVRDITERQQAEAEIRAQTEQVHDLYNNAPCGYHSLDQDGGFVAINDTELNWLGYTRDEVIGKKNFAELLTPSSLATFHENYPAFKTRGVVRDIEFNLIRADGSILPVLLSATAVKDAEGNFVRSRSTLFDVTELKKAREALQKANEELEQKVQERTAELAHSEKEFRSITENALVGIYRTTINGEILYANNALARMLGYSSGTALMHQPLIPYYKNLRDRSILMDTVQKEGSLMDYEIELLTKNGEVRTVLASVLLDENILSGMMIDITERKQADKALQASENRFRSLIENSGDMIALLDMSGAIIYESPSVQRILGYSPEELLNVNGFTLLHPDDFTEIVPKFQEVLQIPGGVVNAQFRYHHKNGSWLWMEATGTNLFHEPTVQALVINYRNITQRKLAEDALLEEKERFAKIAATVPGLLCTYRLRPDGHLSMPYASPMIEDVYGLEPENVAEDAAPILNSIHPDDLETVHESIAVSARTMMPWHTAYRYQHPSKGVVWLEGRSMPLVEPDGSRVWHGFVYDITERKQFEAQLQAYTHQISLLANASQAFAEASLNYDTVLSQIVRHLAKALGDLCIIHLLSENDTWEDLFAIHDEDAATLKYSETILLAVGVGQAISELSNQVIQSGHPFFIPNLNIEQLRSSIKSQYWLLLEPMGIHSLIIAPLNFRRRVMGLLYFIRHRPEQPAYNEQTVQLVRDLADRAAFAITNARLVDLIQKELAEKASAEAEIRRLNAELEQRVALRTEELEAALKKTETLYTIARAAVEFENLSEALQQVVNRVAITLPANRVILLALDVLQKSVTHFVRGGTGASHILTTLSFEDWMGELSGWVLREGHATLSPKGKPDPRENAPAQKRRIETHSGSTAVAPLRFLDQILGTLTVINLPEEGDFSEADLELLEAASNQAAALLVRASLYESLQHTNLGLQAEIAEREQLEIQIRQNEARAQALADISRALAEARLEHQPLFEMIAHRISELLGDSCHLSLISRDEKWIGTIAVNHPDIERSAFMKGLVDTSPYPVGQGLTGKVAQTGKPILIPNVPLEQIQQQTSPELLPYLDHGNISMLIVPMHARDRVIGTIGVSRDQPGQPYTPEDQTFLQDLADRAGLAIENSRLFVEAMEAREEADQANLAKSEFLSRMSHELRTPLNAILGFAQILEMDDLNPRQTANIEHILRAGKHLLGLINEVLEITRIETGTLSFSPEPTRVKNVINETLDLVQALAEKQNIHLDVQSLPEEYILADHQRLKQVLLNLLSNAIKYNQEGGKVFVECLSLPGERLQIRVRDTGPGISPEYQKRLFVPFDRLGAEQSSVEGTGLGLSLSRQLVEAMGGKLGMESELGEGSTFWVELPLVDSPMEQSYHPEKGVIHIKPVSTLPPTHTVLYLEDNLSNLQLIEQIFKYRPTIKLLIVTDGKTGLEVASEQPLNIILLDLNLPDIPGTEILHKLKTNQKTKHVPVVVVSADATPAQINRMLKAGAYAYLTKPLDIQQFLTIIDEILVSS